MYRFYKNQRMAEQLVANFQQFRIPSPCSKNALLVILGQPYASSQSINIENFIILIISVFKFYCTAINFAFELLFIFLSNLNFVWKFLYGILQKKKGG